MTDKNNPSSNYSENQSQTKDTFSYKWVNKEIHQSEPLQKKWKDWVRERYLGGTPDKIETWLPGEGKTILDAGCGAGMSAIFLFGDALKNHKYIGVDISDSVLTAQKEFEQREYPGEFIQTSLMDIPVEDESVDVIFSEGVLHHTDSVRDAINYLATKLRMGGHFLFYVYKKKSPLREYSDDLVREHLMPMDNEEAWEALMPLSKLGKALGELNATVEIPEDIPCLGIPKGTVDVQRLFYWHVCKAYYRPEMSIEEMNYVNFDWFRPLNCIRSTPEEVQQYCEEAGLKIDFMDVQEAGITVDAVRV